MALPLVKVGVLVGAGILGSYLAQEGRVSDVVSGAFMIAWKQIRDDKSKAPKDKKPSNDALMAQMNKIRQELKSYSSSGPIKIITGNRTGASKYGLIIIVIVAGSGYFWWKGWKLPDMMFATRCSLADAGKSISKQIDGVFSSISVTKRQLSSNLDDVDRSLADSTQSASAPNHSTPRQHPSSTLNHSGSATWQCHVSNPVPAGDSTADPTGYSDGSRSNDHD